MQSRFKKIMFIYFAVIVICHCINKTDSENYDHEVDFIANGLKTVLFKKKKTDFNHFCFSVISAHFLIFRFILL